MSLDNGDDILYKLAYDCESHFDQLQQALATAKENATVIQLCSESQQRFALWAAHVGVFARKSQSLDRRLRNHLDLQDLAARLLDVLRRGLQQCIADIEERNLRPDNRESHSGSRVGSEALTIVDDTLKRLTRLGVTIRQSSHSRIDERAKKFASDSDLEAFSHFCAAAIQFLYPRTHQSLKNHLGKSMTDRYARLLFLNSRKNKLGVRRDPMTDISPIHKTPDILPSSSIHVTQPARVLRNLVLKNLVQASNTASESDLSSVNIQQIRARLKQPDEPSVASRKTKSLQVNQGSYPKLPDPRTGRIFTCEWCSEPLNKATLSESDWRRHVDRDLKPYICLSETCPEAHPVYPTLDDWIRHMDLHSRRWYQQIYLTPSWICTMCTFNSDVYDSSQELYAHLDESHQGDFTTAELKAISRQSRTEQSRAWHDCLLCGFSVDDQGEQDELALKRRRGHPQQKPVKDAKLTLEMTNPDPHTSEAEDSDTSSDSGDLPPHAERAPQSTERSKAISRHIAAHLQVLMFLTLRFAALQNFDDEDSKDDFNSESADIDEGNSATEGKDLGRLSDIAPEDSATTLRDQAWNVEDVMELDEDVLEDVHVVPDTDFDLVDIPRQFDNLSIENDAFLRQVVESGAYQTWQDEQGAAVSMSQWKLVYDNLKDTDLQLKRMLEASMDHGETPLLFAIRHRPKETVRDLLGNGADPRETNGKSLETPLHLAASRDLRDIALLLVQHGADVNATDNEGITPLHQAAILGKVSSAEILIQHGADINAADDEWRTPLHHAVISGEEYSARLLIEHGADVNAMDNKGRTPLHHVIISGEEGLALLLIQHGAEGNATDNEGITPLHQAAISGKVSLAEILIQHGAAVDATDNKWRTPLHHAVISGEEYSVRLLIQHGADINATDKGGFTPLHQAAIWGKVGSAEILIQYGADVNVANIEGSTPLACAIHSRRQGIQKLLLESGATQVDSKGMFPSDFVEKIEPEVPPIPSSARTRGETTLPASDRGNDEHKLGERHLKSTDPISTDTSDQGAIGHIPADNSAGSLGHHNIKIGDREQRRLIQRRNAIKTLIDTESIFLRDINILEEIYKGTTESCPGLGSRAIRIIFRNIHEIIEFHISFLTQLKSSAASVYAPHHDRTSAQSRAFSDMSGWTHDDAPELLDAKDRQTSLGAAFCENLEQMKIVHGNFQRKCEQATQILIGLQQDPNVRVWLNECNEVVQDLSVLTNLESFLAEPMQRVNEYANLLRALEEQTQESHPDKKPLLKARRELESVIIEIDQTQTNFELVHQIISMEGKESRSRTNLTRLFSRSDEKPGVSTNRVPQDTELEELYNIFMHEYDGLQAMVDVFDKSGEQDAAHLQRFHTYISAMDLTMRLRPGSYPELQSKLAHFENSMNDLEKVCLEDHLLQLTEHVTAPINDIIKVYQNSALAIKRHKARRLDYEKSVELELAGRRISSALAERVNEYEMLSSVLKKELPMLSSLTKRMVNACLENLARIQARWCETWREQINKTLAGDFGSPELDEIVLTFQRDHQYVSEQVQSLGICNPEGVAIRLVPAFESPRPAPAPPTQHPMSLGITRETARGQPSRVYPSLPEVPHLPDQGTLTDFKGLATDFEAPGSSDPPSPKTPPYHYRDYYSGTASDKAPELPWPANVPRQGEKPSHTAWLESAETPRAGHQQQTHEKYSGIFQSAMPLSDDATEAKSSDTESQSSDKYRDGYHVLFLAASLFEFNAATTQHEAGYPYLVYQAGEIFDVIGEKGELWLAKNQDDSRNLVGWIWSKHFAKLADTDG